MNEMKYNLLFETNYSCIISLRKDFFITSFIFFIIPRSCLFFLVSLKTYTGEFILRIIIKPWKYCWILNKEWTLYPEKIFTKTKQSKWNNTEHKWRWSYLALLCKKKGSVKKGALKNFANFTGKTCVGVSFNTFVDLKACNFIKKGLQHWCFRVKFAKFLSANDCFLASTAKAFIFRE